MMRLKMVAMLTSVGDYSFVGDWSVTRPAPSTAFTTKALGSRPVSAR